MAAADFRKSFIDSLVPSWPIHQSSSKRLALVRALRPLLVSASDALLCNPSRAAGAFLYKPDQMGRSRGCCVSRSAVSILPSIHDNHLMRSVGCWITWALIEITWLLLYSSGSLNHSFHASASLIAAPVQRHGEKSSNMFESHWVSSASIQYNT